MQEEPTRRRFLQAAAVTAALPLAVDAAQEAPASADQALLAIVRQRFKHLTEDQLKAVYTAVQRGLIAGDILKRVRMDPIDEPATIFVADLAE